MDPYLRKDSVSSEVAALLCISGRTSRISSVGSQGSAASRLSAISGLSRSPSPHKMILETSFCGPKPVDVPLDLAFAHGKKPVDALEQILLARKHDPTQAVMAEGIIVKSMPSGIEKENNGSAVMTGSTPRKAKPQQKSPHPVIAPEVKITRPQVNLKASGPEQKKIVGKTQNGTEYIRIKLKPDHYYNDQGLAANEQIVDDINADVAARKPASLNIHKQPKTEPRKQSNSPKPSNLIASGSRSPSPAMVVTTSRKNSFCSLFKSKEVTNTPDSPTAIQTRKKSSASAKENDEGNNHRSRSCGKIKDISDRLSPSPTPSKQKSVLGLFKTKRSGSASKSKCSSPVDHEERRVSSSSALGQQAPASKPRLRYYEPDSDSSGIFIPLHTPPEEKDQKLEADAVTRYNQMLDKQLQETELGRSILRSMNKSVKTPETSPKLNQGQKPEARVEKQDEITTAPKASSSNAKRATDRQPIRKSSRIEYPDGSIRIPLRSPSDEEPPKSAHIYQVQVECIPQKVEELPPNPESVVVVKPQSPPALPKLDVPVEPQVHSEFESQSKNCKVDMIPLPQPIPDQAIEEKPQPKTPPPTPASMASVVSGAAVLPNREKKHILFTTKIGSKEEQMFQTQFSVSKTESLCSPTSEANNAHSDSASNMSEEKDKKECVAAKEKVVSHQPSSEDRIVEELPPDYSISSPPPVNIQEPQPVMTNPKSSQLKCAFSTDDEMSVKEASIAVSKRESDEKVKTEVEVVQEKDEIEPPRSEPMDYKLGPQRTSTTEENAFASSGSDRDSETCTDTTTRSRKHLPHNLAIDEHESTGLVSQISYEDELPYVPTTLPEERAIGIPIISVKERATMEVKTYPVERPRSTTPLNPSFLDDYCVSDMEVPTNQKAEKLKISLPHKDSRDKIQKPRSPRRVSNSSGKSWFEYEARGECTDQFEEPPPPPLPPRATATSIAVAASTNHSQWINFENIPEKRKPPKRITTVPHKDPGITPAADPGDTTAATTVYQFVKPDECQCECHEVERKVCGPETQSPASTSEPVLDEVEPLLGTDSSRTCMRSGEGCNSMR